MPSSGSDSQVAVGERSEIKNIGQFQTVMKVGFDSRKDEENMMTFVSIQQSASMISIVD